MFDRNGKSYSRLPVNEAANVLGRTKALAASIFIDVRKPSHPYYDAIYWAAGKGITKGYSIHHMADIARFYITIYLIKKIFSNLL